MESVLPGFTVNFKSLTASPVFSLRSIMHLSYEHSYGESSTPILVLAFVHQGSLGSSSGKGVAQSEVLSAVEV